MLHKVSTAVGRRFLSIGLLFSLTTCGTLGLVGQKADDGQETSAVPSAVFTNPTAISIPTGPGNGSLYPSPITVSGITGTIPSTPGSVKVTINAFSHTFPDDVGIVLVGPTGAAFLIQDGAGDDPNMSNVTYTLSDSGATLLPDEEPWGPGTYKPTAYYTNDSFPAPGPLTAYAHPGPAVGGGTATFSSVFGGTNPNGTWNLYVRDFVTGDGGTIAGGWSLEIVPGAVVTPQHVIDFDGNGRTDYSVVRNVGGGPGGQIRWIIALNPSGALTAADWGIQGDEFVPEDYDGDLKTDLAVWRPGAPGSAAFYIFHSQSNTIRIEAFGQTGDDPSVVGDYNNDGKADLAVYRPGAPSTWFYRTTVGGGVTFVNWGTTGDTPAPGDYNGDGSHDFVVRRASGGTGVFWRLFSGGTSDVVHFGSATDVIVPGDYDGDGKTDIAVVRGSGGQILWFWINSGTGTASQGTWGNSATDFPVQGDYDGDGKTDLAVWRNGVFWVFGSSASTITTFNLGQSGDYPVANYNAH